MNIIRTSIPDVLILEPKIFSDERGFFMESYHQDKFNKIIGREIEFVQDNHSKSAKGVLRGLHFQKGDDSQGKLIRCIRGAIFDVAVDLRINSGTFGKWVGEYISAENKKQIWIPEGFAHGFLVMNDESEIVYKASSFYNPNAEETINWNDEDLNINWPEQPSSLSLKDQNGISLEKYLSECKNEK